MIGELQILNQVWGVLILNIYKSEESGDDRKSLER